MAIGYPVWSGSDLRRRGTGCPEGQPASAFCDALLHCAGTDSVFSRHKENTAGILPCVHCRGADTEGGTVLRPCGSGGTVPSGEEAGKEKAGAVHPAQRPSCAGD